MSIWWIASYPKSGNTWLRQFLKAYKTGECDLNSDTAWDYDDMSPALYNHLSPLPEDYAEHLGEAEVLAIRQTALVHILRDAAHGRDPRDVRLFLKTHNCLATMYEMPLIPRYITEAAFYLVRDPRDVAASYAHHCKQDIDHTIDVMEHPHGIAKDAPRFHALSTWSNHVKSWIDPTVPFKRHIIKYEDMIARPHETFTSVVQALGWPVDQDRLELAIDLTAFDKLKEQEETSGFREQAKSGANFFRKGRAGGWREDLTPDQVRRIETTHGEMMEELGYGCHYETERTSRPDRDPGEDRQGGGNHPLQECG